SDLAWEFLRHEDWLVCAESVAYSEGRSSFYTDFRQGINWIHVLAKHGLCHLLETYLSRVGKGAVRLIGEKDKEQRTPLMLAAEQGHINILKTLIEYGADIEEESRSDYYADTALTLAASAGQEAVVQFVIDRVPISSTENKTTLGRALAKASRN